MNDHDKNMQWALLAIVLIFSALTAGYAASEGFNEDQMVSYNAALRHIQGQTIYEDFFVPYGPMTGLFFVPFLLIAPTGGWAQILATVALNSVAAFLLWTIVFHITRSVRHAFIAGIITAAFYMPIFGGYYLDHLSYIFVLFGLYTWQRLKGHTRAAVVAILFTLAFHTKQTVAAIGLGALVLCYFLYDPKKFVKKEFLPLTGFSILAHAIALSIIWVTSDFSQYWLYGIIIPVLYGTQKNILNIVVAFFFPYKVFLWDFDITRFGLGRIAFYPVVLTVYITYYGIVRYAKKYWKQITVPSNEKRHVLITLLFLLISTLWISVMVGRSVTEVVLGLGGVFALGIYMIERTWKHAYVRYAANVYTLGLVLLALLFILVNSLNFDGNMRIQTEQSYEAGDLTPIRILKSADEFTGVPPEDIINTYNYMKEKTGPVGVADDGVFIIPLMLRKAPVSSQVFFHNGVTIPIEKNMRDAWEEQYIRILEENNVKYIISSLGVGVREHRSHNKYALDTLPKVRTYFEEYFTIDYQSGGVKVYLRNDAIYVKGGNS